MLLLSAGTAHGHLLKTVAFMRHFGFDVCVRKESCLQASSGQPCRVCHCLSILLCCWNERASPFQRPTKKNKLCPRSVARLDSHEFHVSLIARILPMTWVTGPAKPQRASAATAATLKSCLCCDLSPSKKPSRFFSEVLSLLLATLENVERKSFLLLPSELVSSLLQQSSACPDRTLPRAPGMPLGLRLTVPEHEARGN